MNEIQGYNINAGLSLEYHQIHFKISLNQTSWTEEDNLKINGTLDLKTFLKGLKHLDLTYEIYKQGADIESSIIIRKNSLEIVHLYAEGRIQTNKGSLNMRLQYKFSTSGTVEATLEYKRKSATYIIKSNIITEELHISADTKFKFYPHPKLDLRILNKKLSPLTLRIFYENSDMKKVFKTELKQPNTQIAGLNLQYSFNSKNDIKLISRGKYFLNAVEFDIIRTNTSSNFATNLFIENESIFLARLDYSLEKMETMSNTTIRGKLQSKYNLPKITILQEELCSPSLNITESLLFYDDTEAKMTIRSESEMENSFVNLFLINTNIEVFTRGRLKLAGHKTEDRAENILEFQINEKHFSLETQHNLPSPSSISVRLSGPWSAVSLEAEMRNLRGGHSYSLRLQDPGDRVTEVNVQTATHGHNWKILATMKTPLFEEIQLSLEVKFDNPLSFMFNCRGSETSLNYFQASGEFISKPREIGWNVRLLSDVEHSTPHLDMRANIKFDRDVMEMVQEKILGGLILNLQIRRNYIEIFAMELNYVPSVSSHSIEMITRSHTGHSLHFLSSLDSRELKANLILNQQNIFGMKVLLEYDQHLQFRSSIDCPSFSWKKFGVNVLIKSSNISVEMYKNEKKFEFSGTYTFQIGFISAAVLVKSSFHSFGEILFDISIDLKSGKIEMSGQGDNSRHVLHLQAEFKQNSGWLTAEANLPVLGILSKDIFLHYQYDINESSWLFEAKFGEENLDGKLTIGKDSVRFNVNTPFRNYEEIQFTVRGVNTHTSTQVFLAVNQNNFNLTATFTSSLLILDFSSTLEFMKNAYLLLNYRDNHYQVLLTYNDNNITVSFSPGSPRLKMNLEAKYKSVYLKFHHQQLTDQPTFQSSAALRLKGRTFGFSVNKTEGGIKGSVFTPSLGRKSFEMSWKMNDFMFSLKDNDKELFYTATKYQFGHWVGKLETILIIGYLDIDRLELSTDYMLLRKGSYKMKKKQCQIHFYLDFFFIFETLYL